MPVTLSRWTMPTLRVCMGAFLALWGLDKLFAVEGSMRIFGVNAVSTLASWKQILDPWGLFGLTEGGTHLFLAPAPEASRAGAAS